jgi:hypothetical protein
MVAARGDTHAHPPAVQSMQTSVGTFRPDLLYNIVTHTAYSTPLTPSASLTKPPIRAPSKRADARPRPALEGCARDVVESESRSPEEIT